MVRTKNRHGERTINKQAMMTMTTTEHDLIMDYVEGNHMTFAAACVNALTFAAMERLKGDVAPTLRLASRKLIAAPAATVIEDKKFTSEDVELYL
jgi:hypothetical protein